MSKAVRFAPLALLVAIIAALVWRLATPVDTDVHSAMEGKPIPVFKPPGRAALEAGAFVDDLASGQPHLVNVFAEPVRPLCDGSEGSSDL